LQVKEKTMYHRILDTYIAGIPCQVGVTSLTIDRRHGYDEVDFDVLDRRGRPASWLDKKLGDEDLERIVGEIIEVMR